MTTRERMMACYQRERVDHPACAIYTRYLPRGEMERAVRDEGMGVIDYVPPVSMMAPPWHMLDGFLSEVKGANIRVEYRWEGHQRIERRLFETPKGTLYSDIQQDLGGVGSEHILKHYLQGPEDYAAMGYIAQNIRFRDNFPLVRARIQNMGQDGVVLGRLDRSPFQKLLIELSDPEQLFLDLYDDPEPIEALLGVMEARLLEAASMAMEGPMEVLWLPDNVTAEMTSPALFRKYCLPYYQKLTRMAHQAGKLILAHFDGKLTPLRDDIARAGFDGIESVSLPEMNGDMTLEEARTAFPGAAILPNFPANLSFERDERIAGWARALAEEAQGAPLMIQISEDLPPEQTGRVALALARALNGKEA